MKFLALQPLARALKRLENSHTGIVLSDDERGPYLALIARDGNDTAAFQLDPAQALEVAQWLFVEAVRLDRQRASGQHRLRSRLNVTSIVRQVRDAAEAA